MNDQYTGLTEEDRKMMREANGSLWTFIRALLFTCLYGAIAFLALWSLKDSIPSFLIAVLPDVKQSSPSRLYTYITVTVCGIAWFVTFMLLWFKLEKIKDIRRIIKTVLIWCLSAAAFYGLSQLLLYLATRLR